MERVIPMAYSNRILDNITYYDEIRSRLGTDSSIVSNDEIDSPSILPIAESRIISRVTDYQALTGDDQIFLYAAAIAMVASLFAPSMGNRIKKSEGDSDYKYENTPIDWSKRAKELEDEAYSWVDYISTQPVNELNPVVVSGPTRSKPPLQNPATPYSSDVSLYPTNLN
jgi:hypothetical protein